MTKQSTNSDLQERQKEEVGDGGGINSQMMWDEFGELLSSSFFAGWLQQGEQNTNLV